MLPLIEGGELIFVVVPALVDSRRLLSLAASDPGLAARFRVTSSARLRAFVARHAQGYIGHQATNQLLNSRPEFSAGSGYWRRPVLAWAMATALLVAMTVTPIFSTLAAQLAVGSIFLAWTALRLLGFLSERLLRRQPQTFSDQWLPVYSIIVALYREGATVGGLVAALRELDYPLEKLDVKLVVEPDDEETRIALSRLNLGPPFEVVVAPSAGPRTKPKALNAALQFVRGKFVAVFDAEDRPEPEQLRLAIEAFVAGDERLACVQARLTIDNTGDSWLTRLFTAEYAGLFDVFLPGLSAWRLPLPLGGSSNHFRTDVLRQVGAWDPYNVTEDADLGMRLARFGYDTAIIPSTTYEEAPSRFDPWLRQRTRWFKGWLQTWLVHMRSPRRLARQLGPCGFAVFQLLVGGGVLAALIHGLLAARLAWTLATQSLDDDAVRLWLGLDATMLLIGYAVSVALGLIGLARRRLLGCAWVLLLMPVYWLMLSLAAWRALFQLLRDPYRWEKTEHGLARTSRLTKRALDERRPRAPELRQLAN
jgi:cellulose synthase/poly-beta-1,6-N-acetylglucosamine synthase-like glycosyltransferase